MSKNRPSSSEKSIIAENYLGGATMCFMTSILGLYLGLNKEHPFMMLFIVFLSFFSLYNYVKLQAE